MIICDACKGCDCGKCRTKDPEKFKCDLENGKCNYDPSWLRCRGFVFDEKSLFENVKQELVR